MTVGILGGVGPAATVNFMETLLEVTPARRDQDHIPSIVHNDPTIPDRPAAIRGTDDVRDQLVANAEALDRLGVEYLVIASNLTHYWFEDVATAVDARALHMIRAVCETIHARDYQRIGLLTTTAARDVGLYEQWLDEVDIVYPDAMSTAMDAIYRYKAGQEAAANRMLEDIVHDLAADVEVLVLGCTEFSAMEWAVETPTLDPVEVLARRVVDLHS